jgi:hypothetical protein
MRFNLRMNGPKVSTDCDEEFFLERWLELLVDWIVVDDQVSLFFLHFKIELTDLGSLSMLSIVLNFERLLFMDEKRLRIKIFLIAPRLPT